jgi:hypothetical protein
MLRAILVVMTLVGAQVGAGLDALDAEIAGLKRERAGANTFSDNERRAQIDRQVEFLERVRDRVGRLMVLRVDACMSGAQAGGALPVEHALACAQAGQVSIAMVRRAEEIRDLLKRGNWGWHNRDRRAALQKELEELDRKLGD